LHSAKLRLPTEDPSDGELARRCSRGGAGLSASLIEGAFGCQCQKGRVKVRVVGRPVGLGVSVVGRTTHPQRAQHGGGHQQL